MLQAVVRAGHRSPREYLSHGYFSLLASRGQVGAMVTMALAALQHKRTKERTGTDLSGIREITSAISRCLDADTVDLPSVAMLAVHRDRLSRPNRSLLVSLLAVWVTLGQPERAVDLARSIDAPARQAGALAAVAGALAQTGRVEEAADLARSIVTGSCAPQTHIDRGSHRTMDERHAERTILATRRAECPWVTGHCPRMHMRPGHGPDFISIAAHRGDVVLAQSLVHAGHLACSYSCRLSPSRSRLRMSTLCVPKIHPRRHGRRGSG